MRRIEFMRELSYLLQDMEEADREEALRYYNDYFEDAGPDKEEEVARELGSPEKVAAIIKDGIRFEDTSGGSFTDQGYADERFSEQRVPGTYQGRKEHREEGHTASGNGGEEKNPYHYTSEPPRKPAKSVWKFLLIVLLCLCGAIVLGPLAGTAVVVVLVVLLVIAVVIFAVGISGIAIVISGLLALGSGIVKLFTAPATGIFICGVALLVIAVGILIAWFMGWLFFKAAPPFVNGLIRMARRPFEKRREEK